MELDGLRSCPHYEAPSLLSVAYTIRVPKIAAMLEDAAGTSHSMEF